MSTTSAKICLAIITAVAIAADVLADKFGWCSISEFVRELDTASGHWLRWILVGLLCHWFIPSWTNWGGWH